MIATILLVALIIALVIIAWQARRILQLKYALRDAIAEWSGWKLRAQKILYNRKEKRT